MRVWVCVSSTVKETESSWLLSGREEEPPTEGKARKLVSKKKPTSQHSIAKNTKRQSTEAIQRAMSYDKEVLNVTNNQKNAMISYTVDGNTNLKSLLGELFDSIYQNCK